MSDKVLNKLSVDLRDMIEKDARSELDCREYLDCALEFLCPNTFEKVYLIEKEGRNLFGFGDFILFVDVINSYGYKERRAYFYELKAPQCYIFEVDDCKNRFRPTKDLIKAENQLLYYKYEAENNGAFQKQYGIDDRRNILFGGIVIGRQDTVIKGLDDQNQRKLLFAHAALIRTVYFYEHNGIRLFLWDTIAEFIEKKEFVQTGQPA